MVLVQTQQRPGDADGRGDDERAAFLEQYSTEYNERIESIRRTSSSSSSAVYLDFGGAALYTDAQVDEYASALKNTPLSNPHSGSPEMLERIESARCSILDLFGVTNATHAVIFTSGATAALKLVGEAFHFSAGSTFCYSQLNHNSVLGIREYALRAGATVKCWNTSTDQVTTLACSASASSASIGPSLFAFPAECNFSGVRLPLNLAERVKSRDGEWYVLLDAAKYAATATLDLSRESNVDFTAISFYKMFGLPTGLGALIVRRTSASVLSDKGYFGGGTLEMVAATALGHRLRQRLEHRLEDGSLSFAALLALRPGLTMLLDSCGGLQRIAAHTTALAHWTCMQMQRLRHTRTGRKVVTIFGNHSSEGQTTNAPFEPGNTQGPTVSFLVHSACGSVLGHAYVAHVAASAGIQLRSGRFCNPGAAQHYLALSDADLRCMHAAGHVCGDSSSGIDAVNGRPTGALRISFGSLSVFDDAKAFLHFLRDVIIDAPGRAVLPPSTLRPYSAVLKRLSVYPIKSCAAFEVHRWPLSLNAGLLFDREFAIVDSKGALVTQKRCPQMALIRPQIDLDSNALICTAEHMHTSLSIPLVAEHPHEDSAAESEHICIRVCGSKCTGLLVSDIHDEWFSQALQMHRVRLIRFETERSRSARCVRSQGLGFANEGHVLLVSEESCSSVDPSWDIARFRANLVVKGTQPFAEEEWTHVSIGSVRFTVDRGCTRCSIIDVDPVSTKRSHALAQLVKTRNKPQFGVLLSREPLSADQEVLGEPIEHWITVGDIVQHYILSSSSATSNS